MRVTMQQEFLRQRIQMGRLEQVVVPVDPEAISLHEKATSVLQKAVAYVANAAKVSPQVITSRMFDYVYRLEPSDVLLMVLMVPERDVELIVELPYGLWVKNRGNMQYAKAM